MRSLVLTALVALVAGFLGAFAFSASGLGDSRTRGYLLAHPEILPEMAAAYDRGQAQARLAELGDAPERPFPGAVLGNPQGSKVLVMFSDYACTFCRQSLPEVEKLIAADPEIKLVIREWPIFEGSEATARMALAAAEQGKFAAFHKTLFALGPPSEATVARAGAAAGLDMARAKAFAASPKVDTELAANIAMAGALHISGTPGWIAGGRIIEGYVPAERLAEALDEVDY